MLRIKLILLSLLMLGIDCFSQMTEGSYPYAIIDSLLSTKRVLEVDSSSKPKNFICMSERWHITHMALELRETKPNIEIKDSTRITITIDKPNSEISHSIMRIKKIHNEMNSRAYYGSFSNVTLDTILLPIQDESLIAILEAKDLKNEWQPIQFWPISGCGNSYYSRSILPGKSIQFTVHNDFGSIETSMRLKLHGTDTIYVSNEFKGTINKDVFIKPKDLVKQYKHIMCDSIFYLEEPLYGNLNYDEIEIMVFE